MLTIIQSPTNRNHDGFQHDGFEIHGRQTRRVQPSDVTDRRGCGVRIPRRSPADRILTSQLPDADTSASQRKQRSALGQRRQSEPAFQRQLRCSLERASGEDGAAVKPSGKRTGCVLAVHLITCRIKSDGLGAHRRCTTADDGNKRYVARTMHTFPMLVPSMIAPHPAPLQASQRRISENLKCPITIRSRSCRPGCLARPVSRGT